MCVKYSRQVRGASWPLPLLSSSWAQLWPVNLPLWSGHEGLRLGAPSLAFLCSVPPGQWWRERQEGQWVNVTVHSSTSTIKYYIRGSVSKRQAYTEDNWALWREAGWQERPFNQVFSFNFERTLFLIDLSLLRDKRQQLALQQLISVKNGWVEDQRETAENFFHYILLAF